MLDFDKRLNRIEKMILDKSQGKNGIFVIRFIDKIEGENMHVQTENHFSMGKMIDSKKDFWLNEGDLVDQSSSLNFIENLID